MSTVSLISAKPAPGVLAKAFVALGQAFAARRTAHAFAGMSEREYQDIGWGQPDRHSQALAAMETPPERSARATAVAAWHRSMRKAA